MKHRFLGWMNLFFTSHSGQGLWRHHRLKLMPSSTAIEGDNKDIGTLHSLFYTLAQSDTISLMKPHVSSKSKVSRKHGLLCAQNEMRTVECPLQSFFSSNNLVTLPVTEKIGSLSPLERPAPIPLNSESCFCFLIQVTYGPFDPLLSDKGQFPSLYLMASKDSSLIHGMIRLLLHFDWTWVAVFFSEVGKGNSTSGTWKQRK